MVKQSGEERRFWVRAKRVLSIEYKLAKTRRKTVDNRWHLSTTEDMSYGGLSFYTEQELKKDEILEMRVVMSGILDIFDGFGRIVRVEKKASAGYYLIGVKFVERVRRSRGAKSWSNSSRKAVRRK
jgi:c-di-GMP-binding flagellar brake protein YcgR